MSAAVANFVFADRSKFFSLPDGPEDAETGLPTVLLPVGTELYRADPSGAKEPGANVPAFFTNRGSTRAYTRGAKGTLSSYKVKKEARLFNMDLYSLHKRAIARFADQLTDEELEVFMNYITHNEGNFAEYVNPSGFLPSNLHDYKSGKVAHPNYLNRRMTAIFCRLGFDGWVVKPYSYDEAARKGTGLVQFSIAAAFRLQEELEMKLAAAKRKEEKLALQREYSAKEPLVAYTPEIMLCKWKEHMDLKSLEVSNNAAGAMAGAKARRGHIGRRTRKAQR
jgi:hypothetical protein